MTRPRKKSRRKRDSNPGSSALEADALTTRPTRRFYQCNVGDTSHHNRNTPQTHGGDTSHHNRNTPQTHHYSITAKDNTPLYQCDVGDTSHHTRNNPQTHHCQFKSFHSATHLLSQLGVVELAAGVEGRQLSEPEAAEQTALLPGAEAQELGRHVQLLQGTVLHAL